MRGAIRRSGLSRNRHAVAPCRFMNVKLENTGCFFIGAKSPDDKHMPMKRVLISVLTAAVVSCFSAAQTLSDLPAASERGTCFVEIYENEQVEWVTQRVVDQPARVEIKTHPAVYETVEEKHLIKQPTTIYKTVPPTYKTVFETIEVRPGTKATVAKQVLAEPARVVEDEIPAEYETIEVTRLVSPEREERIEIPATYTIIEKPVRTGGTAAWHAILCDDTPRSKVAEVQSALTAAGYPAVADGIFGPETFAAMEAYQRANGLAVGYLTLATVDALGVATD